MSLSFTCKPQDQSQPNPHQLREGSYPKYDAPTQLPDPGVPQTSKPKQITGEKTLFYKKIH